MRRTIAFAAGLFVLSAALVVTGCSKSKPTTNDQPAQKPAPPSVEVKPNIKGGTKSGGGKLVKDDLDSLPPPVREK